MLKASNWVANHPEEAAKLQLDKKYVSGNLELRYCRKIICNSKIEIRTSIWYTLYYKNTGYSIWQRQIS